MKEPPNGVSCINTVVKEERVNGVFEEQVLCLPLRPAHLPHLYHWWLRWAVIVIVTAIVALSYLHHIFISSYLPQTCERQILIGQIYFSAAL